MAEKLNDLGVFITNLRAWTFINKKEFVKKVMGVGCDSIYYKIKLDYLSEKLDENKSIGVFLTWLKRDKDLMSKYLKLYAKSTKQEYDEVQSKVNLFIDIYIYLYNASDLYIDLGYTVDECNELMESDNFGDYHIYEYRLASTEMTDDTKETLYNNMRKKYYDNMN
jgi:hypothetical protein